MAVIGKVEEFTLKDSDWRAYTEQLESFFVANDVGDAKKPHVLLSVIGKETFALLRNLCAPDKPAKKTYVELITLVQEHVAPKPNKMVERYKFSTRKQGENEIISDYVADLKHLAMTCNFGTELQVQLRDRFVCGINSTSILKRLLSEKNLIFKGALEIAVTMELAKSDVTTIKDKTEAAVNKMERGRFVRTSNNKKTPTEGNDASTGDFKSNFGRCFRCGKKNHLSQNCFAIDKKCNGCGKVGHYVSCCRSNDSRKRADQSSQNSANYLNACDDDAELPFLRFGGRDDRPLLLDVDFEGISVTAELDTGAAVNVMTLDEYREKFTRWTLSNTNMILKLYSGKRVRPVGKFIVQMSFNDQRDRQEVFVVPGCGPVILGRGWLRKFRVNWGSFFKIGETTPPGLTLESVLEKHKKLFDGTTGTYNKKKFALHVVSEAVPKHCRPRTIFYAMYHKAETKLKRLEDAGLIEKVDHSDWATPVVYVSKQDGTVRLCGDYKVTLNPCLKPHKYQMPRLERVFDGLRGGKKFTKIDQSFAYMQLVLDEESQLLATITTHKGLFKVKRLPFGVTIAAEVFQEVIDDLIRDLPGVESFQDDTVCTGSDDHHHLENLDRLLSRYEDAGLRLNRKKCIFMAEALEFLGHSISKRGVQPQISKVKAIKEMAAPRDATQLRAFLGMVNFYGKFVRDLSTLLAPLHNLLRKQVKWRWTEECANAFNQVKLELSRMETLTYFDETKTVELYCVASSVGMGAALMHRMDNKEIRPIAYASRSFNSAERNYSQIDREARAVIFGVRRFHDYLWGRRFTLWTDHKPLCAIFNPERGLPERAAARMQRWAVFLQAYDFGIKYVSSKENVLADTLSRLPLVEGEESAAGEDDEVAFLKSVEILPVTAKTIKIETRRDRVLARVHDLVADGWNDDCRASDLQPYSRRKQELSVEAGCLLWGNRVIIPSKLRKIILDELHVAHPGMVRMKSLARSYVWWPNLDEDIENMVRKCTSCQESGRGPSKNVDVN